MAAAALLTIYGRPSAAPAPPAWKPDPVLLKKLSSEVEAGAFKVRPPAGYQAQDLRGGPPGTVVARAWTSTPRADGVRSYLMLLVLQPPAGEPQHTAAEVLDRMLAGVEQRRKEWSRTPTEAGTINGLPFVRARWNAADPASGKKMRGFSYVAVLDGQIVQLSSQDAEPHADAPLKLAEAAALTFRKK